MSNLAAIPPTMSTLHTTYTAKARLNTSNASDGASLSHVHIILTNIGLPSRPTSHTPWVDLEKPLVIKPAACTQYDMPFVYSNDFTWPTFYQHWPAVAAGSSFSPHEFGMVQQVKWIFSIFAGKLCHKVKIAAVKLSNVCRPPYR
ncbi:hypothetical protein HYPSUDRAFT_68221 [Hypholoma sublateritium FD-334 SS-4]|uniref:Uncharacterized protein n=1 Tax=Hypholoma sublateritium (strain FD-334 SS-4) TaxID=945553 RepID=A0A0D2L2G8_HYPSF|nr:hypothetical protein HYPSUDRAFT_68221 [Hypholoma sublateritium FD-334 SS-4]